MATVVPSNIKVYSRLLCIVLPLHMVEDLLVLYDGREGSTNSHFTLEPLVVGFNYRKHQRVLVRALHETFWTVPLPLYMFCSIKATTTPNLILLYCSRNEIPRRIHDESNVV